MQPIDVYLRRLVPDDHIQPASVGLVQKSLDELWAGFGQARSELLARELTTSVAVISSQL